MAATVLTGNYPLNASTRLVSPPVVVPEASESPGLRFGHWWDFVYDSSCWSIYGEVQIRVGSGHWQPLAPKHERSSSATGRWIYRRMLGKQFSQTRLKFETRWSPGPVRSFLKLRLRPTARLPGRGFIRARRPGMIESAQQVLYFATAR